MTAFFFGWDYTLQIEYGNLQDLEPAYNGFAVSTLLTLFGSRAPPMFKANVIVNSINAIFRVFIFVACRKLYNVFDDSINEWKNKMTHHQRQSTSKNCL